MRGSIQGKLDFFPPFMLANIRNYVIINLLLYLFGIIPYLKCKATVTLRGEQSEWLESEGVVYRLMKQKVGFLLAKSTNPALRILGSSLKQLGREERREGTQESQVPEPKQE